MRTGGRVQHVKNETAPREIRFSHRAAKLSLCRSLLSPSCPPLRGGKGRPDRTREGYRDRRRRRSCPCVMYSGPDKMVSGRPPTWTDADQPGSVRIRRSISANETTDSSRRMSSLPLPAHDAVDDRAHRVLSSSIRIDQSTNRPIDESTFPASVQQLLAGDDVLHGQRAEEVVADSVGEIVVFL